MWTWKFWRAALELMIRSAAQGAFTHWFLDGVINVFTISWVESAGIVLGYVLMSLLTSLGASRVGRSDSPNLANQDD